MPTPPDIFETPLHLGLGARAIVETPITGMDWYAAYVDRHAADGNEGRLVSAYRFTEDWTSWERHPAGEEVVICIDGTITLHQEGADGAVATVTLTPGGVAINPAGVWHTADVAGTASVLFITPGVGTEHRARG